MEYRGERLLNDSIPRLRGASPGKARRAAHLPQGESTRMRYAAAGCSERRRSVSQR